MSGSSALVVVGAGANLCEERVTSSHHSTKPGLNDCHTPWATNRLPILVPYEKLSSVHRLQWPFGLTMAHNGVHDIYAINLWYGVYKFPSELS